MDAPFEQAKHLGWLTTELGFNVQVLLRFDGSECFQGLLEHYINTNAARDDLDVEANRPEAIAGKLDLSVGGPGTELLAEDMVATTCSNCSGEAGGNLALRAGGKIAPYAEKSGAAAGGESVVRRGGAVSIAPILNVEAASRCGFALSAIPVLVQAAADAGSSIVRRSRLRKAGS